MYSICTGYRLAKIKASRINRMTVCLADD